MIDESIYFLLEELTKQSLEQRAAYIVKYADAIGVRIQGSDGRWTDSRLADLPAGVAIREAFRVLLRAEVPVRVKVIEP